MAFSKVTRIILYVVAGISLLVVLFYYAAPLTLDYDALDARVEEMLNPVDLTPVAPLPEVDTTVQDTAAVEGMPVAQEPEQESAFTTPVVQSTAAVDLSQELSAWEYLVYFRTDIALIWAYILVVITLISAIVFPLIAVFSHPKALIRLLAVLGVAAVLIFVSYFLFSSEKPINIIGYTGTDNSDPQTLRMIDTVLFVTYMLFGLAVASILYAVISRAFK